MLLACESIVFSLTPCPNVHREKLYVNGAYRHQARRSYPARQTENSNSSATPPGLRDDLQNDSSIPVHDAPPKARYSMPAYDSVEVPRLVRTPWELERYKRNSDRSSWRRSTMEPALSPHIFKRLPREVYDCVIEKLEQLHLDQDASCASCFMKDLYSLSLTSRVWDRAVTLKM